MEEKNEVIETLEKENVSSNDVNQEKIDDLKDTKNESAKEKKHKKHKKDKNDKNVKNRKSIGTGMLITIIILSLMTIAAIVLNDYIFGWGSVFYNDISSYNVLNTIYHKIPALIRTIQIFTIAYLLNMLLKFILSKCLAKSKKSQTIEKLLCSFIKYLIALVAIFMILNAWGVDTTTLLASAGILGLVIGLGAQSLIADIIAGIFIVFENVYQVGDIIVVGDWRGTVDEIGIRTTKIIDAGGNVKIINNSEISSVINQTKELSLARAKISIEYGESIERVEIIIKNNLDKIKQAIPEIVEGPYYKGVDALGESSVDLLFFAKCNEEDIYIVQRAMNRELKLLFDKNNINIPFPQVTISKLEQKDVEVSKATQKDAQKFVQEQREISKGMEDKK